jgi:hypothetical protein
MQVARISHVNTVKVRNSVKEGAPYSGLTYCCFQAAHMLLLRERGTHIPWSESTSEL